MANRQTVEQLLDALAARAPQDLPSPKFDRLRFEQELEEVIQLAERGDAAHFRERIEIILSSRRH